MLVAAGIPEARWPKLGFHALRKALGTHLAVVNPLLGPMQLNNSARVFATSYVNPAVVAQVMNDIPQPTAACG